MSRAVSPAIGVSLVAALTVVLASVAGLVAVDVVPQPEHPRPVVLSASADAGSGRISLRLDAGGPVDVRRLRVRISVDGTGLRHQPPVPFAGAPGFRGAPTGPFNTAADPTWAVGERAGLRVAGTNAPPLRAGSAVRIEVYRDDVAIARASVTAR